MKLVAVLACRNQSSRLYAKPLQNLDVKNGVTILDYIVAQVRLHPVIKDIVLAISDQKENDIYQDIAEKYGVGYVRGDDRDVLSRLLKAAESSGADHIFRVTTESPYTYFDLLESIYEKHCKNSIDYSTTPGLPDGACFEIIKYEALRKSWDLGSSKHRSELCCSYILENESKFKIAKHEQRQGGFLIPVRGVSNLPAIFCLTDSIKRSQFFNAALDVITPFHHYIFAGRTGHLRIFQLYFLSQ